MRFYWTRASIPELQHLSRRERRQLWNACYRNAYRHWQTWLAWCGYVLLVYLGILLSNTMFGSIDPKAAATTAGLIRDAIPRVAVLIVFAGIGFIIVDQAIARCARPYLAAGRQTVKS